ncbi:MAG: hypothetical protein IH950_08180 [Bacteroidetes bacterium]|nr:hypothetical protein [Bacteroidota bacterium]
MTDIFHHRGNYGERYDVNNNIALGHRSLSMIDIEGGIQPMYNDDKNIIIVYNEEIYNYVLIYINI